MLKSLQLWVSTIAGVTRFTWVEGIMGVKRVVVDNRSDFTLILDLARMHMVMLVIWVERVTPDRVTRVMPDGLMKVMDGLMRVSEWLTRVPERLVNIAWWVMQRLRVTRNLGTKDIMRRL